MIPGSANSLLLASAAGAAQYQIERSLRFNLADSAYLSRTPTSAGNRKTWTWAGWVKKAGIAGIQNLFSNMNASNSTGIYTSFATTLLIEDYVSSTVWSLTSTAVYRDVSSWYHIVVAVDTTLATEADRVKLFVNGDRIAVSGTYPAQNSDTRWNTTATATLGTQGLVLANYLNGYLADVHGIDGQALDPTSFGGFDTNGVWQPKAYTGTYPGNSFHLDFADNSAATTAGIGKDTSGNGNDWTPNNFSVAAGAGNDSLVDTPTNYGTDTGAGGEVGGNYATWNPLLMNSLYMAARNGNLEATSQNYSYNPAALNIHVRVGGPGKWYCEFSFSATPQIDFMGFGLAAETSSIFGTNQIPGLLYMSNGQKSINGTKTTYGSSYVAGDIIGVTLDEATGSLTCYKNGVSQGLLATLTTGSYQFIGVNYGIGTVMTVNAGQRPFAYTAPSGYKALCTTNLPSTTITTSGSYTGNGSADGPFVYLNGVPTAMTVNGNAVTFGTNADKLSNGLKVRTTSTTYNQNAATYNYSITSTGDPFKVARAQSNP